MSFHGIYKGTIIAFFSKMGHLYGFNSHQGHFCNYLTNSHSNQITWYLHPLNFLRQGNGKRTIGFTSNHQKFPFLLYSITKSLHYPEAEFSPVKVHFSTRGKLKIPLIDDPFSGKKRQLLYPYMHPWKLTTTLA